MLLRSLFLLLLIVSLSVSVQAEEKKGGTLANPETKAPLADGPKQAPPNLATPAADSRGAPTQQTGMDRPATLVPANSEEVTVKVQLRGLNAEPKDGELEAGVLMAVQQPGFQVRPAVKLLKVEHGNAGEFLVSLTISRLVAFGESTVSLMYKGRQVETLRFFKTGLIAKPAWEDGFVARQGKGPLFLVIENGSAFEYKSVRARLRFDNQDVCLFNPEKFSKSQGDSPSDCLDFNTWTAFDIPKYAQVTLRATPADAWFVDPASGLARSGKRKGSLTLRFTGLTGEIYEQNVPLEIEFQPSDRSLFVSMLWVAGYILVGALFSVFLRISLPNLKRRRSVKNQLNEVAKSTAGISTAVDSNLRVLLRVGRLELNETLRLGWWFGPNDGEFTQRVEQALPGLKKRIDAVRRLDAALIRRAVLVEQGAGPTRVEQIDELLDPLKESLKQDQLTDEDWVSVNQRIEAVRKLLREPTQTELEAIEGMLAGRWQDIRAHFAVESDGRLKVPSSLQGLENCFPEPSLLPGNTDAEKDGKKWVKSVGALRADLQLTALQLVWDFQFLTPAASTDEAWADAKKKLNKLLATPVTDNLISAELLLRQLASGISEKGIIEALQSGAVTIVMDPQIPGSNQKVRYTVRFLREDLNTAAARELVSCRWKFEDRHTTKATRWVRNISKGALAVGAGYTVQLDEDGWSVYHYFESGVTGSLISVSFHDSHGSPIALRDASEWAKRQVNLSPARRRGQWAPFALELVQLAATLLVPLATLAATTANGATVGHWWQLIGIGFGADTIKNLIAGPASSSPPAAGGTT